MAANPPGSTCSPPCQPLVVGVVAILKSYLICANLDDLCFSERRMNETEREILSALDDLDRMVKSMKTANPKPNLLPVFEKLDSLTSRLGPQGDPSLLHYLHKKSYEKARLFLHGRDQQNAAGNCRH